MNTCKTCKWWGPSYVSEYRHTPESGFGHCDSPKILEGYGHDPKTSPQDAAIIENDEGWGWATGPDFGCIHHEEKK